jgi:iron complex outermembrane receptor protein
VHAVQRNDLNERKADNFSAGWNGVWTVAEDAHHPRCQLQHAKRTDFLLETYSAPDTSAGASDTLKISANPNGTFSIVPRWIIRTRPVRHHRPARLGL